MKRLLLALLFTFLFTITTYAQDEENVDTLPGLTLVSVQSVSEIMDSLPHHSTISPNGNLLVYESGGSDGRGLCIYDFTEKTTSCTPYPPVSPEEANSSIGRPTELAWSPDSRYIALTENSLIYFRDSDIWIFDVENGEYINKTDDGYFDTIFVNEESRGIPVDVLPVWSPDGSLYFFRYVRFEDVDTTELYTIPAIGGSFAGVIGDGPRELSDEEPTLVADFSATVPMPFTFYNTSSGFSLSGAAEISPDGTQMAVLMRPQSPDGYELWIVNLIDGSIARRLPTLGISGIGLPEWAENQGFVPEGVQWLNENELLLNFINYQFTTGVSWSAYHLNLETDDITPIFDFASIPSLADYFSGTETESGLVDYPMPRYAAITPDNAHFLYVTAPSSLLGATLEASPVNGGERLILHRFGEDFELLPTLFTSIGTDGETVRALIFSYIFTFEVVE